MHIRAITLVLLFLVNTSLHAVSAGDRAPSWQGTDIATGATVEFPGVLEGKPAVLVFWATWCPYCKAFMPYVRDIQSEYEKYGVKIVSFNTLERGIGDPKAYVKSLDFPFVAIADADSIAEAYSVKYIPGLLISDGNGQIVYRRKSTDLPAGKTVSEQWADEVRQVLDTLVK